MIRMTVLTSLDKLANKKFFVNDQGKVEEKSRGFPFNFEFSSYEFDDIEHMSKKMPEIFTNPRRIAVLGYPVGSPTDQTRKSYNFEDNRTSWFCLDIDDLGSGDQKPEEVINRYFPEFLKRTDCLFHYSNSSGIVHPDGTMYKDKFRGHFLFACEPIDLPRLKAMGRHIRGVDLAVFSKTQPHFFADPEIGDGVDVDLDYRWKLIEGRGGRRMTVELDDVDRFIESEQRVEDEEEGRSEQGDLPVLVSECRFVREAVSKMEMSEPEWYAVLSLVDLAEAHELSMGDERYDPVETQRKWQQAHDRSGPRTCANISDNFGTCRGCKYNGRIRSPAGIPKMEALCRNYVQVIGTEQFVEIDRRLAYSRSQFDSLHSLEYENRGRSKASAVFEDSPEGKKIETITYRPGGELFMEEEGCSAINLWREEDSVAPVELGGEVDGDGGSVKPWLDHVRLLCNNDDRTVEVVLDWFSFLVRSPGEKINWALFLGGGQGIGKGLLVEPVQTILGWKNCYTITPDDLNGGWTHWLKGTKLVVVEEMASFGKREMSNRLKPLITCPPHQLQINEKNQKQFRVPNLTAWIFMSNEQDALIIDPDDRRFFVVWSRMKAMGDDYYQELGEWIRERGNLERLSWFLHHREMSPEFSPQGRAPGSADKEAMVVASRDPLTQFLLNQLDEGVGPFAGDLVWGNEVMDLIDLSFRNRGSAVTLYRFGKSMNEAGFVKVEPRVKVVVDGVEKKRTIYIVRNKERYEGRSSTELRDQLVAGLDGSRF